MLQATVACVILSFAVSAPAEARQAEIIVSPPFTSTLSNTTPLVFGMTVEQAAQALRTPLHYLHGRPGNEMFLTYRHGGGSGFFPRSDRLFLQFRNFRLAGWKGDWGSNWMWP